VKNFGSGLSSSLFPPFGLCGVIGPGRSFSNKRSFCFVGFFFVDASPLHPSTRVRYAPALLEMPGVIHSLQGSLSVNFSFGCISPFSLHLQRGWSFRILPLAHDI
jgi:hypothetical protein